jgi:hypothetical protein
LLPTQHNANNKSGSATLSQLSIGRLTFCPFLIN